MSIEVGLGGSGGLHSSCVSVWLHPGTASVPGSGIEEQVRFPESGWQGCCTELGHWRVKPAFRRLNVKHQSPTSNASDSLLGGISIVQLGIFSGATQ